MEMILVLVGVLVIVWVITRLTTKFLKKRIWVPLFRKTEKKPNESIKYNGSVTGFFFMLQAAHPQPLKGALASSQPNVHSQYAFSMPVGLPVGLFSGTLSCELPTIAQNRCEMQGYGFFQNPIRRKRPCILANLCIMQPVVRHKSTLKIESQTSCPSRR